jgi:protein-S-isoprenylcysteine O-methyltransferase Ste14
MRFNLVMLLAAAVIFLVSNVAILKSLETGSRGLAISGGVGNAIAAVLFISCAWIQHRKVDWERIEREQKLWESGPLGRKWLRMRRRTPDQWKS